MQNILEIDSVYRYVNPNFKLSDIYLKCKTGDIIGIVGRNGAGKSLLLKIIFGTEKAENKLIRINGKPQPEGFLRNSEIVYLSQDSFLPFNLSVKSVVKLFLSQQSFDSLIQDEIISGILNTKVKNLSGGEQRYLEVKLLLNSEAKFVLLDEPLNALSPIMKEKMLQLIQKESKTKGIIITDHDFENLSSITTELRLMLNGSLKTINSREDLVFWKYLSK
jgi:ABC-type multidrug transport system ATPase subunit